MMTLESLEVAPAVAPALAFDKKDVFEALYAEHEPSLRRLAFGMAKNEFDADDLFQESMLRAFRSFHLFEEGTNFGAWVHIIMRNVFFTDRRKEKLRPTLMDVHAVDAASLEASDREESSRRDADGSCTSEHLAEEFQTAIRSLPERYRKIVELSDVCGKKYREVAEEMGIPQGTVMSRLFRGRRIIRQTLRTLAA